MAVMDEKSVRNTHIVPFVQATRTVLEMSTGVKATFGAPFRKAAPYFKSDVSGIINLFGELMGAVVISMPRRTADRMVAALVGAETPIESPLFADAIGELANMIVGSAKKDLNVLASITLPTVIVGDGHCTPVMGEIACIVIPFKSDLGEFNVEVSIKQIKPVNV